MNSFSRSTGCRVHRLTPFAFLIPCTVLVVAAAAEPLIASKAPPVRNSVPESDSKAPLADPEPPAPKSPGVESDDSDRQRPTPLEGEKPSAGTKKSDRNDRELDRQLLRDLLPDLPLDLNPPKKTTETESADAESKTGEKRSRIPFADELDETIAAMREVSRRLDRELVSGDTEQIQDGIVANIDALIEKLESLPPPSSSSSSDSSEDDSSEQNQSTDQPESQAESQTEPQNTPQKQPGADSSAGSRQQPQQGKAAESSEQNQREARERAAALARRRALVDEVWGHLPPAMRERLLNVQGEKLLPKYEDLIRRYYESLAEPVRIRSTR